MLDELRDLFLRALEFDGDNTMPLIAEWNDAISHVQEVVDRMTDKDTRLAEVRHGRWHRFSKGSGSHNGVIILSDAFQCTVCKESFWNKSNYCPSCGAKNGGQDE